jgi:hypothetical protein
LAEGTACAIFPAKSGFPIITISIRNIAPLNHKNHLDKHHHKNPRF